MATYPATYDAGSSDRGPSTRLWQHFPADTNHDDPRHGMTYFEDFWQLQAETDQGTYAVDNLTSGTFALDITVANIGVARIDSGAATVDRGAQVQWHIPLAPEAGRKIGFETRVKLTASSTGPFMFMGFATDDTTIISDAPLNTVADHIGFEAITSDNVLLFHTEDGGTRVSGTTPHTMVDDTYVKLGFLVEGTSSVTVYVDGAETDIGLTAPDIPDGSVLLPSFVCHSAGTTQPVMHLDWFKVGTVN